MASLTEAASITRRESVMLRHRSAVLRADSQGAIRVCEARRASCRTTLDRTARNRDLRFTSGWSDLLWGLPGPELHQVLVVVDGDC
jgi:hypothetical protein